PFQAENLLKGRMQNMVVGPYELTDTLGTGSMGTVYKARSKNDDHWYAVKILPRRDMWNLRLVRRAIRALEETPNPGIVPFVDVGTSGGTHYLVWRLAEGETLDKIVTRHGKLKPNVAALCALQAAETLDLCHKNNLVHGLIKPSNLIVGPDQRVRILDFGIGPLLSEAESMVHTQGKANLVTSRLDCGSPESIMDPNNQLPASDQYSLGCTLYFLLTGRHPFSSDRVSERIMAHQLKQPTPIGEVSPAVPVGLAAVVQRLLQKSPEARYANMSDVVSALEPLAAPPSALTALLGPAQPEGNGRA